MKKYILFFTAIVFFIGCFDKGKRSYKKKYYPSGKLKSYGYYIQDSIPVDTIFTLYEDGKISAKEVYDSIGNAVISVSYFESGIVSQEINYQQGLANGFLYDFFKTGFLKQKSFYVNDIQVGDTYYYSANGVIDTYGFYEWKERNINLVKYDSVTGMSIKDMRQTIYLDSVKVARNTVDKAQNYFCDIILVISNPPKCRSTVRIDYLTKNGFAIKSDTITGQPFYFTQNTTFPDSLFAIKFTASQYDSLTGDSYEQWNRRLVKKK
jgi:hypothetical protein